jgi:hypothetical protein
LGNPKAGVLTFPSFAQVGVGGVVVVVGIGAAAVAAEKAHIIDQRLLAGLPEDGDGARVDSAGEDADAAQDVVASGRGEDHGLGCADAFITGSFVEEVELGERGVEADEHGVRREREGVA